MKRDIIRVEFIPPEHFWQQAKWKLLEEYNSGDGETNAPVGFITDGATLPPFVRKFLSPTGNYFGAAIVHDYIIHQTGNYDIANEAFKKELIYLEVGPIVKAVLMAGVRTWALWRKIVPKRIK